MLGYLRLFTVRLNIAINTQKTKEVQGNHQVGRSQATKETKGNTDAERASKCPKRINFEEEIDKETEENLTTSSKKKPSSVITFVKHFGHL